MIQKILGMNQTMSKERWKRSMDCSPEISNRKLTGNFWKLLPDWWSGSYYGIGITGETEL